jgi:hypothetical protein
MNINILVTASALSDHDLLARLDALAGKEREASTELVAHLAALDSRPTVYAAQGYSSLFSYCTQALRLSQRRLGAGSDHQPRPATTRPTATITAPAAASP